MKTPAIVYVGSSGHIAFSAQIDYHLFQFFVVEEPAFAELCNVAGLNRWQKNVFNTMDELDAYAKEFGFVKQVGLHCHEKESA
jgi:hypothetical protein